MPGFSSPCSTVIKGFARDMGFEAHPATDGSYSFEFSRSGLLSFTGSEDGQRVIISLSRRLVPWTSAQELRFMMFAGFDPASSSFLHAGISDDGVMIGSLSVDDRAMSIPTIHASVLRLASVLDDVDAG